MVRLIEVQRNGRTVWIEDAPKQCAAGHAGRISPGRDACPQCGEPVRAWTCWTDGCTAPKMYDPDHEHRARA